MKFLGLILSSPGWLQGDYPRQSKASASQMMGGRKDRGGASNHRGNRAG
jgi:hypothetical protein